MAIKKSHDWPNDYAYPTRFAELDKISSQNSAQIGHIKSVFVINLGILDTEIIHLAWIFDLLRL